jgi:hypothetical protein
MSTTDHLRAQEKADQFGLAVAARLADATAGLPYEVQERLRAARVRALEQRKLAVRRGAAASVVAGGRAATLGLGGGQDEDFGWAQRIASVLPLLVLAAGLVLLHGAQNDFRASEVAEFDQLILTDDLPPAAYADPGFVQFLRSSGRD